MGCETFALLVKRLREQAGLTQQALADRSTLSPSLISKFERDDKNQKASTAIRSKTLELLADGLGLSTDSRHLLFEVAFQREQRQQATTSRLAQLLKKASFPDEEAPEGFRGDYSEPQVLVGMQEIADCAIWMLDNAPPLKKVGAEEILVTTQGSSSIFQYLGQSDRWSRALRSVMRRNWNVVSLYRMTGDIDRALEVISEIRDVSIRPEQYRPRYFKRIGELRPPFNLLIVPRIGVLFALSTHNPSVIDAAFFYPAKHSGSAQYIDSLVDHFNLLYAETVQLARTYTARSAEWEDTLVRSCQLEADDFLATDYIDCLTMPPALLDELLKQMLRVEKAYSDMAFRRLKTYLIQRRDAFERNVRSFKYRTIMRQRSFTEVLHSETAGICRYPVPNYPNKCIAVAKRQVFEHIEYLIRDLRRYDNYEIALIEENHRYEDLLDPSWRVKGEAVVLIQPCTESADGQGLQVTTDLEITEPSLVRAFRQEFLETWNAIADQDKATQKENVISWLTKLLEEANGKPVESRC